jgi:diacylglycerol O-acyltransferase / trehalose O-mycolyltransferase
MSRIRRARPVERTPRSSKASRCNAAASQGNVGPVDHLPPDFPTPVGGQLVESITLDCTQQFADAAKAAGVPISFVVRPEGAHTWGLFDSER